MRKFCVPITKFVFATFIGVVAVLPTAISVNASTFIFTATLSGANEVPPNLSSATGNITATLDDVANTLAVNEVFSGLTGGPASAAHIHCCMPPGVIAPVVLPFTAAEGFPIGATSGSFAHIFNLNTDLTGITVSAFIAGLEGGLAYANIHNATFPVGEIRGQLPAVPLPAALPLFATGLGALSLLGWRRKKKAQAEIATCECIPQPISA
jgi:hypothetical protein